MSLTPSARITFGNLVYATHVSSVCVTLSMLPCVNSFKSVLPSIVEISAATGDDAVLELDGGEGAETVLTGKIRRFHRGVLETTVSGADAGADLAAIRPRATFEKQSAKQIIRALADDAGVDAGTIDLDLPLPAYVAHQRRTSAEHIADLARLAGAIATVDGDGTLQVFSAPSEPDIALLHGREIMEIVVDELPAPRARRVAIGAGPAGSADAPNALRQTIDILPGGAPESGPDAVWLPRPLLRTPAAALTASQAADVDATSSASRVHARCFLLPALRPGMVVQIQQLPDAMSGGPWLLTCVQHSLQPRFGGVTAFEGVAANAGSLLDLLGSALSAIGSLL
jgi:hypothetical protein